MQNKAKQNIPGRSFSHNTRTHTVINTPAVSPTLRSYWSPSGSWCWGQRSRPPSCGSTTQCQCGCRGTTWLPKGAGKEPPWWRWCTPACESESASSPDSRRGSDHTRSRTSPLSERGGGEKAFSSGGTIKRVEVALSDNGRWISVRLFLTDLM